MTEAELNGALDDVEAALQDGAADGDFSGAVSGLAVSAQSVPDMTVRVTAGVAYDQIGNRIDVPSLVASLDLSLDYNSVPTAVSTSGHTKRVSVFLEFDRALSDPRVDGNNTTIFFERAGSYKFRVVQGAETLVASPDYVVTDPGGGNGVLLCTVTLLFGQSTVQNSDISTDLRDDVFSYVTPANILAQPSPLLLRAGTVKAALKQLMDFVNAFLGGSGAHLAAADVDYAGGAAWADGTTNPTTTVESQLDKFINDLISTTASHSGSAKIGAEAGSNGLSSGTIRSQLDALATNWLKTFGTAMTVTTKHIFNAGLLFGNTVTLGSPDVRTAYAEGSDTPTSSPGYRLIYKQPVEVVSLVTIYSRLYVSDDGAFVMTWNLAWSGTNPLWTPDKTSIDGKIVRIGGSGDKAYISKYFASPLNSPTDETADVDGILQGQIDSAGGNTTTVNSNGVTSPTAFACPFKAAGISGTGITESSAVQFGHRFPSTPSSLVYSASVTANVTSVTPAGATATGCYVDVVVTTGSVQYDATGTLTIS